MPDVQRHRGAFAKVTLDRSRTGTFNYWDGDKHGASAQPRGNFKLSIKIAHSFTHSSKSNTYPAAAVAKKLKLSLWYPAAIVFDLKHCLLIHQFESDLDC